jgi:hypothetical protein
MSDFEFDDDAKDAVIEFAKILAMKFAKSAGSSCGTVIAVAALAVLLPVLGAPASAVAIPVVIAKMKEMADDFNS